MRKYSSSRTHLTYFIISFKPRNMDNKYLNRGGVFSGKKRLLRHLNFVFMLGLFMTSLTTYSQTRNVSGKVTDASGEGLPGVNILEKGTLNGVATDIEGNFTISVGDEATLVFTYIGFSNQEIAVGGRTMIDIVMEEDYGQLDEIVVVGYGTQEAKDVTGSVAKITEAELVQGPIGNPLQQIAGKAAGVNINQVGSEPGQAPNIRIRGITSLSGGNDPLIVVDGIQGGLDLLNQVPPSEIASFEILKDASATAVYGSRGAAGVVIITTKNGISGTSSIEYSGTYSVDVIPDNYDILNSQQWRDLLTSRGQLSESIDFGGNTDWVDEITQNGYTQNHTVAISGGSNDFTYRSSITAILQEGIVRNSRSENYIARFRGSQSLFDDRGKFDFNLNVGIKENNFNNEGAIAAAVFQRPTDPIYTDNPISRDVGNYFIDPNVFGYVNPVAVTDEVYDNDKTNSLFASARFEYEVIDGLKPFAFGSWRREARAYEAYVSARTTIDDARNIDNREDPENQSLPVDIDDLPDGEAFKEYNYDDEKIFNIGFNYDRDFGDHSISFLGLHEYQIQSFDGGANAARGFIVDDEANIGVMQSADPNTVLPGDVSSYVNSRKLSSFLGRVNYTFKDKYILTASYRRDGSSVFGENNAWGDFYSGSAAWRIGDEEFIQNIDLISDLKLRIGYGQTGNQQGLDPYQTLRLVQPAGTAFFKGQLISNFSVFQDQNEDLRWEVKKQFNVGLDFGLFNNRLTGTVEYFNGVTSDLLFNYGVPVPPFLTDNIRANVGEVLNEGIEFSFNYVLLDQGDWFVNLGGNLTSIRTSVEDLNGQLGETPLTTDYEVWGTGGTTGVGNTNNAINHLIIGQPLGVFYVFRHAGVDDSGNQIFDDLNGDGVISNGNNENADRYIAGQPLPKVQWAFTPSVSYKKFDLNLVVRGAHGHKVYNARAANLSSLGNVAQSNVLASAESLGLEFIERTSDLFLEDGGFVRMENVTLGYNFGKVSNFIQSLRMSFTANNLFVITGYTGLDPEVEQDGDAGFGIDNGIYPRVRSFAIGLNAKF